MKDRTERESSEGGAKEPQLTLTSDAEVQVVSVLSRLSPHDDADEVASLTRSGVALRRESASVPQSRWRG